MASHEYINNLLSTMVYTGLSVRAKNIFDACYRTGQFRWGKTATLVAGASVYIVLRESKKLEMLKEIAVSVCLHFLLLRT